MIEGGELKMKHTLLPILLKPAGITCNVSLLLLLLLLLTAEELVKELELCRNHQHEETEKKQVERHCDEGEVLILRLTSTRLHCRLGNSNSGRSA